jgi:hypothetical protein
MISIFPLWTFHLYVETFQQHQRIEYIYLSLSDIPLKDRTKLFSFFREASVWIKEHVGETRSTVGTRRYFVKSHLKPNSNYNHQNEIIKWLAFWISTFPRFEIRRNIALLE